MIGAIVVLYNPDFDVTSKALEALTVQVDKTCIVDNSSSDHSEKLKNYQNIEYIPLGKNIGIAAAQNIGIRYFIEQNFDFVIFSDQDSIAPSGLIHKLYEVFESLASKGFKIAAVGPTPVNRKTSMPYITKANIKRKYTKQEVGIGYDVYEMYSIISSFSLVKMSSFDSVGLFEKGLFIDGVDDEWGWRAFKLAQMSSFIVPDLMFSHYQGVENNDKFLRKKSSPFRTYYQFRNFIFLLKRPYTPRYWKKRNLLKFFVKMFYYPCFVSPRIAYLKAILRGCKDGLLNRYN